MAKSTISGDPVSEQDKFMLRLPRGMRDEIAAAAKANGRSMNAEIVSRIESAPTAISALEMALERFEEATEDLKHHNEVARWMLEQQKGVSAILEEVVRREGKLDEGFVTALKLLLDARGKNTDFPEEPPKKPRRALDL